LNTFYQIFIHENLNNDNKTETSLTKSTLISIRKKFAAALSALSSYFNARTKS